MTGTGLHKKDVWVACCKLLESRLQSIELTMTDLREAIFTETKSSAGDKHETARARLHNEQSQLQAQWNELHLQLAELKRLEPTVVMNRIAPGSLVESGLGYFLIAAPIGKVQVGPISVQVISPQSPLALKLMGLKRDEVFELNGATHTIVSVQ